MCHASVLIVDYSLDFAFHQNKLYISNHIMQTYVQYSHTVSFNPRPLYFITYRRQWVGFNSGIKMSLTVSGGLAITVNGAQRINQQAKYRNLL